MNRQRPIITISLPNGPRYQVAGAVVVGKSNGPGWTRTSDLGIMRPRPAFHIAPTVSRHRGK